MFDRKEVCQEKIKRASFYMFLLYSINCSPHQHFLRKHRIETTNKIICESRAIDEKLIPYTPGIFSSFQQICDEFNFEEC